MRIDLKQASDILEKTEDEVMYLVQTDYLKSYINEDMQWEFELQDILTAKKEK